MTDFNLSDDFKMSWGLFVGFEIEDIPSGYLNWLSENSEDDFIATLADTEWNYRERFDKHFYRVEEE